MHALEFRNRKRLKDKVVKLLYIFETRAGKLISCCSNNTRNNSKKISQLILHPSSFLNYIQIQIFLANDGKNNFGIFELNHTQWKQMLIHQKNKTKNFLVYYTNSPSEDLSTQESKERGQYDHSRLTRVQNQYKCLKKNGSPGIIQFNSIPRKRDHFVRFFFVKLRKTHFCF